jgi:hypothetical protein
MEMADILSDKKALEVYNKENLLTLDDYTKELIDTFEK